MVKKGGVVWKQLVGFNVCMNLWLSNTFLYLAVPLQHYRLHRQPIIWQLWYNTLFLLTARKDHSPEEDHTDTIVALTACQRMKLFASASLDGTVRVWSDSNQLIRYASFIINLWILERCNTFLWLKIRLLWEQKEKPWWSSSLHELILV